MLAPSFLHLSRYNSKRVCSMRKLHKILVCTSLSLWITAIIIVFSVNLASGAMLAAIANVPLLIADHTQSFFELCG